MYFTNPYYRTRVVAVKKTYLFLCISQEKKSWFFAFDDINQCNINTGLRALRNFNLITTFLDKI